MGAAAYKKAIPQSTGDWTVAFARFGLFGKSERHEPSMAFARAIKRSEWDLAENIDEATTLLKMPQLGP